MQGVAAHVHVLVPSDVHGKDVSHLQPTPGALLTEHDADQLQGHRQGDLGSVVVTGEVSREETAKTVPLHRRLGTEVDEPGDGGLTNLQPVNARSFRERGDRLQIRGLDWPVVTDCLLRTPVAAVLVTVGGVVLRDPVNEGRRHATPRQGGR